MCRGRIPAAILAALVLAPPPARAATPAPIAPEAAAELLRKSDIAGLAPPSFRARFRIAVLGGEGDPMDVEVWRSGDSRSLVRFLGPKEKGKYLIRIEDDVWFLAPGARKPIRLSPAHRLRGGASIDDILGIRYARDYAIRGAAESTEAGGPLVVLDLVAKGARAPYPEVHYAVRRATARPVRAEFLLKSGKPASIVEFLDWEEGSRPVVRRLVLTDLLRSGQRTEVTLLEMEERKAPDALFDLDDPAERRKLADQ